MTGERSESAPDGQASRQGRWSRISQWARNILSRRLRRQVRSLPDVDTDDVVQSALRRLWQREGSVHDETAGAQALLAGIARNVVSEKRRNASRQKRNPELGEFVRVDEARDAEEAVSVDESLALREAVEGLPEEERTLIQELYFEGLTAAEAASRRGWSKAKASRMHAKALQRMQGWIDPEVTGGEEGSPGHPNP